MMFHDRANRLFASRPLIDVDPIDRSGGAPPEGHSREGGGDQGEGEGLGREEAGGEEGGLGQEKGTIPHIRGTSVLYFSEVFFSLPNTRLLLPVCFTWYVGDFHA